MDKTLKSVIIVGTAHPFRGGFSGFNQTLALTFKKLGVACRIFTFTVQYPSFLFPGKSQFSDDPAPQGVEITRVLSSVNPLSWIRTGLRLRREKPDAVVVRYWIPLMAPALGTVCRIARGKGIRTIALLDNVIPHEKRPGDSWLTRYFVGSIDGFIYMSEQVHGELRLFDASKPALFSPHPMFTNYGEKTGHNEACKALGLDPALKYTLFFGYIRDYKGLDLLLEAWAILYKKGELEGHRLIVAGEYYSGRERYAAQIDALGIRDSLVLFDHFIAENEVGQFFSAADLVVQPYRSATQSGVTQVAYYFDVPMVVTDVGGLREIVPDGEAGFVVPPEPGPIASAVERYYGENLQAKFRDFIRVYKERFTWEQMAENFRTLYDRIGREKAGH